MTRSEAILLHRNIKKKIRKELFERPEIIKQLLSRNVDMPYMDNELLSV